LCHAVEEVDEQGSVQVERARDGQERTTRQAGSRGRVLDATEGAREEVKRHDRFKWYPKRYALYWRFWNGCVNYEHHPTWRYA
jgi:hypothetical protein